MFHSLRILVSSLHTFTDCTTPRPLLKEGKENMKESRDRLNKLTCVTARNSLVFIIAPLDIGYLIIMYSLCAPQMCKAHG